MTDYSELKRLAEACDVSKCADEAEYGRRLAEFYSECEPEEVLALIVENERLTGFVVHRRAQADQYDEALIRIADQRDQFKAENEALRKDAERYRFLRSVDSDYAIYTPGQSWEDMTEGHLDAQVDESIAIDAAMRKEAN